jgi:nucleoside phosphorylase
MEGQPIHQLERVALLFAMHAEGDPIAERLDLGAAEPLVPELPARIRLGTVGTVELWVVTNGVDPMHEVDRIGTESATLVAWLTIEKCRPQLLINAGTCGGFESHGAKVGDAYLAAGSFLYHDHHIPIPGFRELGEARIPAQPFDAVAALLGIETGVFSSGSSIEATEEERAFFEREHVVAKDMEATAIAAVARDRDVPFLAIKAVTDLVDHPEPSHEAFLRNLASTSRTLSDLLERLLRHIGDGVTLSELGN